MTDGARRDSQEEMCIHMADSHCCTAEASGQTQLGNESQGLPDGQVGEQLVMLAHVGHTLPHQLRCAGLPIDPDLA